MKSNTTIKRSLPSHVVDFLLKKARIEGCVVDHDEDKNKVEISNPESSQNLSLRLPINYSPSDSGLSYESQHLGYIILLIQAGSAALGYFENDINYDHKVFKSYMVRKKQGKSQIKYLNAKGKSRAGSRVRLANTLDFFENINERLTHYFEDYPIDKIAISCSKTLIPYLHNSKMPCPFDKKDDRIYKIPKHIHTPGLEVLMQCHQFLMQGEISYQQESQDLANQLITDDLLE